MVEMLWTDFLNSEWHDWRGSDRSEDRLDKPAWLAKFLEEAHLMAPVPPSEAEFAALKAFRARLRSMAEKLAAGGTLESDDQAELNRVMAVGPVLRRVEPEGTGYRLDLVPVHSGWAQVMAEVAASFADTLSGGEGARVRICENPDCRWVFYDETKNRAKRFCDDKACGNLMKVRRFRARQKREDGK
jgi:predicted RNA-binding Zn ribbon-like protein